MQYWIFCEPFSLLTMVKYSTSSKINTKFYVLKFIATCTEVPMHFKRNTALGLYAVQVHNSHEQFLDKMLWKPSCVILLTLWKNRVSLPWLFLYNNAKSFTSDTMVETVCPFLPLVVSFLLKYLANTKLHHQSQPCERHHRVLVAAIEAEWLGCGEPHSDNYSKQLKGDVSPCHHVC